MSEKILEIYRLKKSKDYPNPASNSDGILALYDSSFDNSRNLARILTHELGHQNYNDLKESDKQDYRRATNWDFELGIDRKYYRIGRKSGYVEEDGNTSPEEDYANNLEYFIYNPDKLRQVTPNAYEWIKKRFGPKLKLKERK